MVREFQQKEEIDYHETFASVVKPMSYKAIFAIAAAWDWDIHQMDIKTAFFMVALTRRSMLINLWAILMGLSKSANCGKLFID